MKCSANTNHMADAVGSGIGFCGYLALLKVDGSDAFKLGNSAKE